MFHEELMYIKGQETESASGQWIQVENPSKKGTYAGRVPRADKEDVDRSVRAAYEAFNGWKKVQPKDRGAILMKIAGEVEKRAEEIARTIASENGNAIRTQSRGEVKNAVERFRYYGGLGAEMKGMTYPGPDNMFFYSRREPLGVVAAIIPWNAPVQLAVAKMAPVLLTGNTLVLKVASDAPLAALHTAKIAARMLPPGVLNVISGPGEECGEALLSHPLIRKISLTGSTEVGKKALHYAADRVLNSTLELGGKNPQIVFSDCDFEKTVQGVIPAARLARQGQSCSSGSRVYVHKSIFDKFVSRLCQKVSKLKVGNACDEINDMGAISSSVQYNKIIGIMKQAMAEPDTRLICGGLPPEEGPLAEGYFLLPTVFTARNNDSILAKMEVFGPILVCIPWEDENEVIDLANDTDYGLAAFLWSRDVAKAIKTAQEINAGWIVINGGGGQVQGQPYGGMKESGLGREHSLEGMLESYTELKSVIINLGY